jgi:hypothetical protein
MDYKKKIDQTISDYARMQMRDMQNRKDGLIVSGTVSTITSNFMANDNSHDGVSLTMAPSVIGCGH